MATPHEDLGSAAGTVTNTAREFADPAFNSTQSILDSLDAEAREDANEGESGADDDAQPQESQDGTGAKKGNTFQKHLSKNPFKTPFRTEPI